MLTLFKNKPTNDELAAKLARLEEENKRLNEAFTTCNTNLIRCCDLIKDLCKTNVDLIQAMAREQGDMTPPKPMQKTNGSYIPPQSQVSPPKPRFPQGPVFRSCAS